MGESQLTSSVLFVTEHQQNADCAIFKILIENVWKIVLDDA